MLSSEDPISRVHEGMRVVDATGDEVGKVQFVRMGDPEAITTEGNEGQPSELMGKIASAVLPEEREPDVPEPLRTNLLRTGYVKIDGPGLRDTGREHLRAPRVVPVMVADDQRVDGLGRDARNVGRDLARHRWRVRRIEQRDTFVADDERAVRLDRARADARVHA